jgi:hypothetical protein
MKLNMLYHHKECTVKIWILKFLDCDVTCKCYWEEMELMHI